MKVSLARFPAKNVLTSAGFDENIDRNAGEGTGFNLVRDEKLLISAKALRNCRKM
jgi:hypothetical protein